MIWMILEWGKFLIEKILITPIPWPSLSFWVIVKCLFCHSMIIQIANDLRMEEMMLEWEFSHPGMMVSDLNEGGMRIFLKQGKCPRFFSFSFCPHSIHILSFMGHGGYFDHLHPWPSLSFLVILKWLYRHSMAILTLNDLRMIETMLEWRFSHPGMI